MNDNLTSRSFILLRRLADPVAQMVRAPDKDKRLVSGYYKKNPPAGTYEFRMNSEVACREGA